MIVVGTKGASALEYSLRDSNTHKLIHATSSCPLLVIPRQSTNKKEINTFSFTLDLKRSISQKQLNP